MTAFDNAWALLKMGISSNPPKDNENLQRRKLYAERARRRLEHKGFTPDHWALNPYDEEEMQGLWEKFDAQLQENPSLVDNFYMGEDSVIPEWIRNKHNVGE